MRDSPKEELHPYCLWGTVQRRSGTLIAHGGQTKGGVEPIFLVYGQFKGRPCVQVQSKVGAEPLRQTTYAKNLWPAVGQRTGISRVMHVNTPVTAVLSCVPNFLASPHPIYLECCKTSGSRSKPQSEYYPTLTPFSCRYSSQSEWPQLLPTSRSASHRSAARLRAPEFPAKRKTGNTIYKDCLENRNSRGPGDQDINIIFV